MEVREPSAKYLARPGYKQTKVGVIPQDWECRRLEEIASVSAGGTPSRQVSEYWNGDIPWVTTSEIDFKSIQATAESISHLGLINSAAKLLRPETLLMALYGQGKTRGKVATLGMSAATNQACAAIVVDSEVSHRFVFYWLASSYEYIRGLSNFGNQENLNGQIVRSIAIPLPPTRKEQQAIADALGDADALIESLEHLLAKQRLLRQATMQALLTGERRLPGFEGAWRDYSLGDLATIQRGASPRPIDSPIWFDRDSAVGWVRISDVPRVGMYLTETTQRLSEQGIQRSRPVPAGSLIMSICATVGLPVITKIDTCIHDGFVVFESLRVDQMYLYYVLKSLEDTWRQHGQTGSQMNLNTGIINTATITVPTTQAEQTAIATVLSDLDAEIAALEARIAKARLVKQGMMQELLTGRIRLV